MYIDLFHLGSFSKSITVSRYLTLFKLFQTIGRSSNPVAMAGDRVLHLGVIKKENEVLPKVAKEN
jgi:hypothetical protein